MSESILEVRNLSVIFDTARGSLHAVNNVSFSVQSGECLGIAGESGSGKTVTCLSLIGLIEEPGRVAGGQILFRGRDLVGCSGATFRELRGREISMIFQDPLTSLNPVFTVESLMTDVIKRHSDCSHRAARRRALQLLTHVGISSPEERIRQYPFQLSGGLRQRVMIAMALSSDPKLVIADEPTTALDVSIQAQILDLLQDLKNELGFALMFVSHDLGVIANLTDRALIMYAGRAMEQADTETIFTAPRHPYTVGLLRSAPSMSSDRREPLYSIEGSLPDLTDLPPGCPFAPRCEYSTRPCLQAMPEPTWAGEDHFFACYNPVATTLVGE